MMADLIRKDDELVSFRCPGCDTTHSINVDSSERPRWTWNGSADKPTFTPSVLVRSGHHLPGHKPGWPCWCTYNQAELAKGNEPSGFDCNVCHSFITDGQIQFLSDCTHALAGQTVQLPKWEVSE